VVNPQATNMDGQNTGQGIRGGNSPKSGVKQRKEEEKNKKSRCTIMELTSRLRVVNQRKLIESLVGAADVGRRERCRSLCSVITSILRLSWPLELAQAFSDHTFDGRIALLLGFGFFGVYAYIHVLRHDIRLWS
jgi:hypothetical protein